MQYIRASAWFRQSQNSHDGIGNVNNVTHERGATRQFNLILIASVYISSNQGQEK